jgi:hypothetical protein
MPSTDAPLKPAIVAAVASVLAALVTAVGGYYARIDPLQDKVSVLESQLVQMQQKTGVTAAGGMELVKGEDMTVGVTLLRSETLRARDRNEVRDKGWDARCAGIAGAQLERLGFRVTRTTASSSRGQKGSIHLLVRCASEGDAAQVVFVTNRTDRSAAADARTDLVNRLRNAMPELRVVSW